MLLSRIILFIQGAMGVIYSAMLLIDPAGLAAYMGLSALSGDGQAELFAMYVGMSSGVGSLMLYVSFTRRYLAEATFCLAVIISAIALARLSGLLVYETGSYTLSALAYDVPMSFVAWWAVRRNSLLGES
jgi:hypothetical protein